jgi:REP element-mobilizing transposase RayT
MQDELLVTHRNLPHWELGGSTYFLTYRCAEGVILDEVARSIVLNNWHHWQGKRYLLHTAVVMPDHVHVLITPKADREGGWYFLKDILHATKSYTAHEINKVWDRTGHIWQDERFDRIIRDADEFLEKWTYMATNPVKAGLVQSSEMYRWLYQNPEAWLEEEKSTGQRPVPPKRNA